MNRKVLKVDAPNADATKRHDSHSLSGRCRSCRGLRILRRTKNASFITRPGYVRQKRYEILPPSNSVQLWNPSRQAGSTKRLA
jgi:hypothetical protein